MSNEKLYTSSGLTMRVIGSDILGKFRMRLVGWLIMEVEYFVRAFDMSNGKCYTSSRLATRVMGNGIFGKVCASFC